jgi:hypothetical protein
LKPRTQSQPQSREAAQPQRSREVKPQQSKSQSREAAQPQRSKPRQGKREKGEGEKPERGGGHDRK